MLTGHVVLPAIDPYAIPAITTRRLTIIRGVKGVTGEFSKHGGETLYDGQLSLTAHETPTIVGVQPEDMIYVELRDYCTEPPPEKATSAGCFLAGAHIGEPDFAPPLGHIDCWFEEQREAGGSPPAAAPRGAT